MADAGLAAILGNFIAGTRAADIPGPVLDESRIRLLDSLACAIAGARNITTRQALKWANRTSVPGPSTHWLSGRRGTTQDCALTNSILAHSILHEDACGSGHPGCNVIPSALAVAEAERSSGMEVLAAIALGYELQARITARGSAYSNVRAGALRPTAMSGIFGSVGVASRLMRLTPEQSKNAIAFCASLCSPGIGEPLIVGSFERSIQMGQLTRSGILAAELAWAGLEGADSALDGECGFYPAYLGMDAPIKAITQTLGKDWISMPTDGAYIYKPYPTAALNIGGTFCALRILKDHKFAIPDITKIVVQQSWWDRNTGYIFKGPFRNVEQALMSGPFAVATALVFGRFDWPTLEAALGNKEVDDLAGRITVHGVIGAGRRRYESAAVEVQLRDGRRLQDSITAMPEEMVTLDWARAVEKFDRLTSAVFPADRRAAIVKAVLHIDSSENVLALCAALADAPG